MSKPSKKSRATQVQGRPTKPPPPQNMNSPKLNKSEPQPAFKAQVEAVAVMLTELLHSGLQALDERIQNLENQPQTPDYQTIFSRIDQAEARIEELISARMQPSDTAHEHEEGQVMTLLNNLTGKLNQALRANMSFQAQVRQGMQDDLVKLRKQVTGEQFTPVLKDIAAVYADYQNLLEDESISDRSRENLETLFEQLEDILNDYGAEIYRSEPGSERQARFCKIAEKKPTSIQEQHNTIVQSRKPGVRRGQMVLHHESVDVYVYDPDTAAAQPEAESGSMEDTFVDGGPGSS